MRTKLTASALALVTATALAACSSDDSADTAAESTPLTASDTTTETTTETTSETSSDATSESSSPTGNPPVEGDTGLFDATTLMAAKETLGLECQQQIEGGSPGQAMSSLWCINGNPTEVTMLGDATSEEALDKNRTEFKSAGYLYSLGIDPSSLGDQYEIVTDEYAVFTYGEQRAQEFASTLGAEAELLN